MTRASIVVLVMLILPGCSLPSWLDRRCEDRFAEQIAQLIAERDTARFLVCEHGAIGDRPIAGTKQSWTCGNYKFTSERRPCTPVINDYCDPDGHISVYPQADFRNGLDRIVDGGDIYFPAGLYEQGDGSQARIPLTRGITVHFSPKSLVTSNLAWCLGRFTSKGKDDADPASSSRECQRFWSKRRGDPNAPD